MSKEKTVKITIEVDTTNLNETIKALLETPEVEKQVMRVVKKAIQQKNLKA
jgi:hypothetical protein